MNQRLHSLKNGVRVLEIPVKDASSMTVLVLFGVGSRYEEPRINGLSHFLEHMFFKGSGKRPKAEMIAEAVDAVGGEMNAFTSKEYTGYYIKCASQHAQLALDILSDMLGNPLFEKEEIDRERGVITQEIKMYEDQPMIYVGELFEQTMYGDTALGRLVIGPRENIASVTREDFVAHRNKYYTADNMVVVLAGDLTHAEGADSYFADFRGSKGAVPDTFTLAQSGKPYLMHVKKTEQTHLWLGFPAVPLDHQDRIPFKVLSAVLGGGMSSRLFLQVRERRGLAYYVRCSVEHYLDTGYMAVSSGVDTAKFEEACSTILAELARVRNEKIEAKELDKAKEYVKGKLLLRTEQSDELAELLGLQEVLLHKRMTPDEINTEVDKVTAEDCLRIAREYMTSESLRAAVISGTDYSDWLEKNLTL